MSTVPGVGSVTYRVERAPLTCAAAAPSDFAQVGADIVDLLTYSDTPAPSDGRYCYFVQADDGVLPANSNQLDVRVDNTAPVVTGVTHTGGDGCSLFTLSPVVDASAVYRLTANGTPSRRPFRSPFPLAGLSVVPVSVS